jgi:hypothetical protein
LKSLKKKRNKEENKLVFSKSDSMEIWTKYNRDEGNQGNQQTRNHILAQFTFL